MNKKKVTKKAVSKPVEKESTGPKFKYIGDADDMMIYGRFFDKGMPTLVDDEAIAARLSINTDFERC